MPMIESPPTNQQQDTPKFSVRIPRHTEDTELHFLLEETVEERDRSRIREAIWISIILHMSLALVLILLPRFLPKKAVIAEREELKDHNLTYLDIPKNLLPPSPPKPSNVIADKNMQQQTPLPDQKMLQKLLQSQRQGAPGQQQQQQQAQQQMAQQTPQQVQQPDNNSALNTPAQTAQVQQQPEQQVQKNVPDFKADMSAGRNIQQAARDSSRGGHGTSGDFGLGQSPHPGLHSGIDVLSDTMGVDFDPYLRRVKHDVEMNWYNLIPEEARAPLFVQGKVAIQFVILKDGSVSGLKIIGPSGDSALDRAAQGGIDGSNPFPPLPSEFSGQYLALRFYFYYNPKNPAQLQ